MALAAVHVETGVFEVVTDRLLERDDGVVQHDLCRGDVRCSKMLVRNQMHTACNVAHQQVAIVAQRADLARHERHLVRPP